eukprot:1160116-Pelagomonas_calceolata.AAC.7
MIPVARARLLLSCLTYARKSKIRNKTHSRSAIQQTEPLGGKTGNTSPQRGTRPQQIHMYCTLWGTEQKNEPGTPSIPP